MALPGHLDSTEPESESELTTEQEELLFLAWQQIEQGLLLTEDELRSTLPAE